MYKLQATIKIPSDCAAEICDQLRKLGAAETTVEDVAYDRFIGESRLYWDYVFESMKNDRKAVTYIYIDFVDSEAGRKAAFDLEFKFRQIPLNLRYEEA